MDTQSQCDALQLRVDTVTVGHSAGTCGHTITVRRSAVACGHTVTARYSAGACGHTVSELFCRYVWIQSQCATVQVRVDTQPQFAACACGHSHSALLCIYRRVKPGNFWTVCCLYSNLRNDVIPLSRRT